MDYRDEVFLAVAQNLSFSKAAKDLFISQPAVTNHIKELETRLKVSLFDRKGHRIYLSKAGKLVFRHLKQIKQRYKDLEFELGKLNDIFKGAISIGASSTIAQYLIPQVLAAFHKHYPQIKLTLYNGNSLEMENKLLNNEIDLALVENAASNAKIKYLDFLEDEIVVVTGSNSIYAKRSSISLNDLKQTPIVLREKGSGTLDVIRDSLLKLKIDPEKLNILIHLGSTEAIKNFLCDFDGIALISEKSIEKELALKSIHKIKAGELKIKRKFRIAQLKGPMHNIPALFIDFVRNYNF
jgi:DNA-binding transcriptional LysR family regulator